MKLSQLKHYLIFFICIFIQIESYSQKTKTTSVDTMKNLSGNENLWIEIKFLKGDSHNYPSFALWIESPEDSLLKTIYVSKAFVSGVFNYQPNGDGTWSADSGKAQYPAGLPYFLHKYYNSFGKEYGKSDNQIPIVAGISGATPKSNFVFQTSIEEKIEKFKILVEVNQTMDWNDYWTNHKYSDDKDYKSSGQPSVVYSVTIDLNSSLKEFYLNPIGHGQYSGTDGLLYTDLSTLTTSLKIFDQIIVKVR